MLVNGLILKSYMITDTLWCSLVNKKRRTLKTSDQDTWTTIHTLHVSLSCGKNMAVRLNVCGYCMSI